MRIGDRGGAGGAGDLLVSAARASLPPLSALGIGPEPCKYELLADIVLADDRIVTSVRVNDEAIRIAFSGDFALW